MTVFLMIAIMALIIGIQAFIPFFVKKTEVFGVYVPLEYSQTEQLKKMRKHYAIAVLLVGGAAALLYGIVFSRQNASEETMALWGVGLQLALLLFSMALYLNNHLKVKKEKKQQGWIIGKKEKIVVDLQFRQNMEMVSGIVFVLPMIITIGLILYTLSQYSNLPGQIPVHWGPSGPDRFTEKTVFTSISIMLVLLVMQIMFLVMNWARKTSGSKIGASQKVQSRERELASRKYGSWLLLISTISVTLLLGSLQLSFIHSELGNGIWYMTLIIAFLIAVLGGTALYAFKVIKSGSHERELPDPGVIDADHDEHWKAGIFYVNKEDSSVMVEKRFGIGWTVNFGNPKSWLFILLPLAVLLLIAFLT